MILSHHTTIDIGQCRWNRSVIRHDDICNYNDSDNGYGLTLTCNILNIMTELGSSPAERATERVL